MYNLIFGSYIVEYYAQYQIHVVKSDRSIVKFLKSISKRL